MKHIFARLATLPLFLFCTTVMAADKHAAHSHGAGNLELVVQGGTVTMIDQVMQARSFNKKTVEVIGVSFDKEVDREKVMKFIKDQKITWPVHFDGKEAQNGWAAKMNVGKAPAIVLFDKKGMFVRNNQNAGQLEGELKRLIEAK